MKYLQIILLSVFLHGCSSNKTSFSGTYCPDCSEWLAHWRQGICLDCWGYDKKVLTNSTASTMLVAELTTTKERIINEYR